MSWLLSTVLLMSIAGALLCGFALLGSVPVDPADVADTPEWVCTPSGAPVLPDSLHPSLRLALTHWGLHRAALHDLHSGQVMRFLPERGKEVAATAVSSRGDLFAVGYYDGTLVFIRKTETEIRPVKVAGMPTALALSEDGTQAALAVRDEEAIYLWDTRSGQLVQRLTGSLASWLEFSPDGQFLASGGPRAACIWDLANGERRFRWREERAITALQFSPDGKLLALGAHTVAALRDAKSGELRWSATGNGPVRSLAFSPDGELLAVACGRRVRLHAVDSGSLLAELARHRRGATCVAFSPDGEKLLYATQAGIIRVVDVGSGEQLSEVALSAGK